MRVFFRVFFLRMPDIPRIGIETPIIQRRKEFHDAACAASEIKQPFVGHSAQIVPDENFPTIAAHKNTLCETIPDRLVKPISHDKIRLVWAITVPIWRSIPIHSGKRTRHEEASSVLFIEV